MPDGDARAIADTDPDLFKALVASDLESYQARDYDRWRAHFLDSPRFLSIMHVAGAGLIHTVGFEAFEAMMRRGMAASPKPTPAPFEHGNFGIKVSDDMAWVAFDQRIEPTGDRMEPPELCNNVRVFERTDEGWKIAFHGVWTPAAADFTGPAVEVDEAARILWQSPEAAEGFARFRALTNSHGTLRAHLPKWDKQLRATIKRAAALRDFHDLHADPRRRYQPLDFPVVLGDDDDGNLMICKVHLRDFRVFVSFADDAGLDRDIATAAVFHGLSERQVALITRIARGETLVDAAEAMGVSPATARTQLRRMFDKTGARTQSGLLRLLLS